MQGYTHTHVYDRIYERQEKHSIFVPRRRMAFAPLASYTSRFLRGVFQAHSSLNLQIRTER